jgi:hypothetical protein
MEDIVIHVPTKWTTEDKENFKSKLEELNLPDSYRILVTNKTEVKFISADVMDRLRGLND